MPSRIVTNDDLARTMDTSNEWIVQHTGILERRICAAEEAPSDLACEAARRCLANAGLDASQIDLIVVATATPDQSQPAVACLVQDKLGAAQYRFPAFDVNSVCAGFVFGLDVAQSMMLSNPGQFRNAMVIGADAFSKILNWQDRRTCIFFGDGAGAVLLSQTDDTSRIHFRLGSDGRGNEHIRVPAGGSRVPLTQEVLDKRLNTFFMNGPRVWDFAVETVPQVIRQLLEEHALTPNDVDLMILHQSNLRMIEAMTQSLGIGMEKTVTTVEHYGNTAAASIPLTLQAAQDAGRLKGGDRVVLCGFGGGLSWGAALLEW